MSEGIVLPFRRPKHAGGPSVPRPHAGLAIVLQVVDGQVELLCGQVKLVMAPADAREVAQELLELADDADGGRHGA
jgi:hypothetical protein